MKKASENALDELLHYKSDNLTPSQRKIIEGIIKPKHKKSPGTKNTRRKINRPNLSWEDIRKYNQGFEQEWEKVKQVGAKDHNQGFEEAWEKAKQIIVEEKKKWE